MYQVLALIGSSFHFHRVFRGIVGESVAEHIRRVWLERAAARLRNSSDPIIDIALDAGYEAHESFTRAFYAAFGESPSAFRRANGPFRRSSPPQAPDVECVVQRLAKTRIAYLSHVGPYETVGAARERLMVARVAWARRSDPWNFLRRPRGDPARKTALPRRSRRAGFCPAEHDIRIGEIGGGEYPKATHRGPYSRFSETYAGLRGIAIPRLGREIADAPPLEFYRNSPRTAKPKIS